MNTDQQVALVVGGSGDIGRAITSRLAELEYRIALTGRTDERIEEAVRELRESGAEARGFQCDLADERSIATFFEEFRNVHDRLDVLVNAAGMSEPRSMMKADQRHFEETLRVNLVGPGLVAGRCLALMRQARRGTIINIASMAGVEGQKGFGSYGASKGGLIALADSLRAEAARFGVRVATISPDKVDTRMHSDTAERTQMITPHDVAEAVAFLLSLSATAEVREVRIYNSTT